MAPYRQWYIVDAGSSGVHIQTGDQVIGRQGRPGAYVHHSGKFACLDADGLDELARAATAAAADVRERASVRPAAPAEGVTPDAD